MGEELVENHLRGDASPQVDDNPHPVPIGLVVQVDDAVDLPLFHEIRNAYDQR